MNPTPSLSRRHLHEIDVVRLATFAAVIALHTLGSVAQDEVGTGLVLQFLHFGRETFFLVTGFVLVFTALGTGTGTGGTTVRFWRKRFALVGLPYTVWTLVYWFVRRGEVSPLSAQGLGDLGDDLLFGTARYHLYFLQISMQVYLVFPLLAWFLHRTRRHHLTVLVLSGAVQIGWFCLLRWVPSPGGWAQTLWTAPNQLLLTYQFYLVAGGIAAHHYQRVLRWVSEHPRRVAALAASALAVNLAVHGVQVGAGENPLVAAEPLQPVFVLWGPAAALALLALGVRYARSRRPGPISRTVREAARISFGVYLAHPLVLTAVLDATGSSHGGSSWPLPVVFVLVWTATVVGSVLLVELLGRTPVSVAFTGRARVPLRFRTRNRQFVDA